MYVCMYVFFVLCRGSFAICLVIWALFWPALCLSCAARSRSTLSLLTSHRLRRGFHGVSVWTLSSGVLSGCAAVVAPGVESLGRGGAFGLAVAVCLRQAGWVSWPAPGGLRLL